MSKSILRKNHPYMHHEILESGIKMGLNLVIKAALACLLIQGILLYFLIKPKYSDLKKIKIPSSNYTITSAMINSYLFDFSFGLNPFIPVPTEWSDLLSNSRLRKLIRNSKLDRSSYKRILKAITKNKIELFKTYSFNAFRKSFYLYLLVIVYIVLSISKSLKIPEKEFIRGARLSPRNKFRERLLKICQDELNNDIPLLNEKGLTNPSINTLNIKVNDIYIPRLYESTHAMVLGTTSIGKSTLLHQIIDTIIKRQKYLAKKIESKMLVYDPKGEFFAAHNEDNRAILFYPFDNRCIQWTLQNEIKTIIDFDMLATSLFEPPDNSRDEYWYRSARDIFSMGLKALWRLGRRSNRDISRFFGNIVKLLKDAFLDILPIEERGGIKHVDKSSSTTAASIISILQERIYFLKYLNNLDGGFSFRDWVNDNSDNRNIFLLNVPKFEAIFRPLMTFVVDIICREILSILDVQRFVIPKYSLILDEFGTLSRLSSIVQFITRARGLGGSLIIANQDISSIKNVYGENQRDTIFNNINTVICGRLNDPYGAEYISKAFGKIEVAARHNSHQVSPDSIGDRVSINAQDKIEDLILPSQLTELDRFMVYIRLAGIGLSQTDIEKRFFNPTQTPYEESDLSPEKYLGSVLNKEFIKDQINRLSLISHSMNNDQNDNHESDAFNRQNRALFNIVSKSNNLDPIQNSVMDFAFSIMSKPEDLLEE